MTLPQLSEQNVPYYVQIYDIVYDMIQNGSLKEGDMLPGENVLASYWDVSRSTVRMAVRKLEEDGLIYKMQGKKTTITGQMQRNRNSLSGIANPCLIGCLEPVTRVDSSMSIQNGGKLVGDLLGIEQDRFNALAVDCKNYVQDEHVPSSLTIVPIQELEKEGIIIDDKTAIETLILHTIYKKSRNSRISMSAIEWTEDEIDKPNCSILLVVDEVLEEGGNPISYYKYWMDSNWYRFSLERRR